MLTLTRRVGETLNINLFADVDPQMTVAALFRDGPIVIAIHEIHNRTQVRIGIQAPVELLIVRAELIGTR